MKIIFFFNFFSLNDRFIISEFLIKSIKLPKCLILVAFYTKKCMFWKSVEKSNENAKVVPLKMFKEVALKSLKAVSENQDKKTEFDESGSTQREAERRRNFGRKSLDCVQIENESEAKKEKEKLDKDSNVAALNLLAFTALFLVIFICDMAIWISIGF